MMRSPAGRLAAVFGWPKISSFDPPLASVFAPHTTQRLLALFTHQSSWPSRDHVAVPTRIEDRLLADLHLPSAARRRR
jgi:hypothetical protein